ncbi:MAG: tetratricopeptide repeat protein [Planctomycetes bacterium]|nr:tetratricopeptide repeat protein [Planctomycetota bacterium]
MTELSETKQSPCSQDVAACLAVALLAIIVNVNAVWSLCPLGKPHGFVFDDYVLVVDEPAIQSLSPGNILHIFTTPLRDAYRPLRVVSYAIDFALWGLNPVGYHLVNILLHAVNCALVYLLIRTLGGELRWAALAALLFAVHPVNTESVAGIAGRKDVLGAALALSSLVVYVTAGRRSRPVLFYALSLLLFLLAFFTKEVMVALLGPMAAYEFCFERKHWLRNILRRQVPFLLTAIAGFILWRSITHGHGTLTKHFGLPFAIKGLGGYLRLAFFPVRLSIDYNALPIPGSFLDTTVLASLLALFALAALAVAAVRKHGWLTFAIVWFFAMLLPLSNLLIPIGARLSERYLYAPLIGWCIGVGGVLAGMIGHAERGGRAARQLVCALVATLIIFFALGTLARNRVWRNDRTLWSDSVQNNYDSWLSQNGCGEIYATYLKPIHRAWYRFATPHFLRSAASWPKALSSLVDVAILRKDWKRAGHFAQEYTERQPDEGPAWAALGKVYARQGKWDEALGYYQKAVDLSPWEGCFWWDIGLIYSHKGDYDTALKYYSKASHVTPTLQDRIAADMGAAYLAKAAYTQAIPPLKQALAADPSNAKIAGWLALAYEDLGRYSEAIAVCTQTMNASPKARAALLPQAVLIQSKLALKNSGPSTELFARMGNAALTLGRTDTAIDYLHKAVTREPKNVGLKCFLANAYMAKRDFKNAEDQLAQAATLNPKDASVWLGYAILYATQDKPDDALENLRKAIDIGGDSIRNYARDLPQFRRLQKDKRFGDIIGAKAPPPARPSE